MPYIELPEWRSVVKGKHLILDTDVLIAIIEFAATDVLEILKELGATLSYINPVYLELMNTDSARKKLERSALLSNNNFALLPTTATEIEYATRIQKSLPIGSKSKPSATDLYLGGTLARYSRNNSTYLLTGNLKDYPMPIFTREAFIPLFNDTDLKGIAVIQVNMQQILP